ncbi:PEP-utilizing enzyme [Pseudodesulfovibrio tunisiensis]|uniref:PEP-utilizing enzyme n=1 Tax=Pseudodesulfovibrio tunisiensis TaxID=463192 RepID=UPI001FB519F3|nr:PEP/pyruvate-binding domain-containing protein [Pseudodesulfovibrio tunisiensis]
MFSFCTKANTLDQLRCHIHRCVIPDNHVFTVEQWHSDSAAVLDAVRDAFHCPAVIVRSSARGEDSVESSMAGMFDSVPDVPLSSEDEALSRAVESVIASYAKVRGENPEDQILIQPMLQDIDMAGVVFTQDLNSGAPYYIINYDDSSGRFDSVTAGNGDINRTLAVRRDFVSSVTSSRFRKLLAAVDEIESLTGCDCLDIEFIVSSDETVHVVQIRPMAVSRNWNRSVTRRVNDVLEGVKAFVKDRMRPVFGAAGSRSVFGIMPDWNPVEMLGAAPRRLAVSLYEHLITDSVWAEARAEMGYRDMSNRPLMVGLGGRQYIDVRESFNSFLPAEVRPELAETLVSLWLDRLVAHPELHDKVEFEVAVTVHTPDFRTHVAPRLLAGLSPDRLDEFEDALKQLTRQILDDDFGLLRANLDRVERLDKLNGDRERVGDGAVSRLLFIRMLLEDCRINGTRPFSIVARCAFIAESMLRSLINLKALRPERAQEFRSSIRTVLSDFLDDLALLQDGVLPRKEFLKRYGHLRPSSYDILSLRYDQRPLLPSSHDGREELRSCREEFVPTPEERMRIDAALAGTGYGVDAEGLFRFMREAIAGREYVKFKFSRHLSSCIELIAAWGEGVGLTREELAHLDIRDILACASHVPCDETIESSLRDIAARNASEFRVTQALRLPYLIVEPSDVDVVPLLKSRPNFVTTKAVQAPLVHLRGDELKIPELKDKIVLVEGADPGFDWIFSHRIAGLVTKYGGANSHMAIRCAELDLPAAIGCGEQLFAKFLGASEIRLDCASEHILTL